jgi:hypothetical protein
MVCSDYLDRRWDRIKRELQTRETLRHLGGNAVDVGLAAEYGTPVLAFPRSSDVRALYGWVKRVALVFEDDWKEGRPVDAWGQVLKYRFPSRRPEQFFELYSVGPNGIDEAGDGDDIRAGQALEFRHYREHFENPDIVNAEWLERNYGHLVWGSRGKIVPYGP